MNPSSYSLLSQAKSSPRCVEWKDPAYAFALDEGYDGLLSLPLPRALVKISLGLRFFGFRVEFVGLWVTSCSHVHSECLDHFRSHTSRFWAHIQKQCLLTGSNHEHRVAGPSVPQLHSLPTSTSLSTCPTHCTDSATSEGSHEGLLECEDEHRNI